MTQKKALQASVARGPFDPKERRPLVRADDCVLALVVRAPGLRAVIDVRGASLHSFEPCHTARAQRRMVRMRRSGPSFMLMALPPETDVDIPLGLAPSE